MVRYGVWNGIKYDNTLGNDKTPEGLDLKALTNFNPGNPIDVVIGNAGFLVFDDSVSLAGVLLGYYEKVSEASCGRCTPCRTGHSPCTWSGPRGRCHRPAQWRRGGRP